MNTLLNRRKVKSRVLSKGKTIKQEEKQRQNVLDPFSTELPPCIADTCLYLEQHGLHEEGVFRVPGFMNEVRDLKAQYDKGKRPNLAGTKGIHTVGSLLKHYLAELAEPLLTFELIDCFMLAADVSTAGGGEEAKVEVNLNAIKSCLRLLPPANMAVLDRITSLFVKITRNSEKNNMTASNIATCLSPVIMRREEDPSDVQVFLEESKKIHSLITTLIEQYELLFDKKAESEAESEAEAGPSRADNDEKLNAALRRGSIRLASSLIRKERERSESLQNVCHEEEMDEEFPLDFEDNDSEVTFEGEEKGREGGDGGLDAASGTPSRSGRAATSKAFLKAPIDSPAPARRQGSGGGEVWTLKQNKETAASMASTPSPNRTARERSLRERQEIDDREALEELAMLTAEAEKLEEEERRLQRDIEERKQKREEEKRARALEEKRREEENQRQKEELRQQELELEREREEIKRKEAEEAERERQREEAERRRLEERAQQEKERASAEESKWKAGDLKRPATDSVPASPQQTKRDSGSLAPPVKVVAKAGGLKIVRRSSGRVDSVSVDEEAPSSPSSPPAASPKNGEKAPSASSHMKFVSADGSSGEQVRRHASPVGVAAPLKKAGGVQQVSQILSQESPRPIRANRGRGRGRGRGAGGRGGANAMAGDARGVGISPMRPRATQGRGRGSDGRGRGGDGRGRGGDVRGRGNGRGRGGDRGRGGGSPARGGRKVERKEEKKEREEEKKERKEEQLEEPLLPPKRRPRKMGSTGAVLGREPSPLATTQRRASESPIRREREEKEEEEEEGAKVAAVAQLLMAGKMRDASVLVQKEYVVPEGYSGDLKNGRPHGKGTLVTACNDLYRGEFKDGQQHGKGELRLANGDTYTGDFVNGVRHGKGVYVDVKGNKYSGQYAHGKRCGQGVQLFACGIIYEGEFQDGLANGMGKTIYKNQDEYVGWHKKSEPHGRGKTTGKAGGSYEGFYKEGLRHGKGCLLSVSGSKFTGEFHEHTMHGYGRYEFTSGDVYEGEFSHGKFCGLGRYSFGPDQTTSMMGRFENGQCVEELEFDLEELLRRVERAADLSIVPHTLPPDILAQESGTPSSL